MNKPYRIRHATHNLEELSQRYFINSLPNNWAAEKPQHDYGIDLRVDIFEGELATGLELLIQLKASKQPSQNDTETIYLRTATYNHLWDKLQVVMLVKYVESENEAYWLLLKDVPEPKQEHETFTVHIPRENRLSTINWEGVYEYVREVTDEKLVARRARRLQRHKSSLPRT